MRLRSKQSIIRFSCLSLVFLLLLSSCGGRVRGVSSFKRNDDSQETAAGDFVASAFSVSAAKALAKDENLTLFYDPVSARIAVQDHSAHRLWTTPQAGTESPSYELLAEIAGKYGRYTLNSGDHCAAFDGIQTEALKNGLRVIYSLSDRARPVRMQPSDLSADDLLVSVPVEYRLDGGKFTVTVNCADIYITPGYVLETLAVLPCFGALTYGGDQNAAGAPDAQSDAGQQDFILLPDGCGAVLYPNTANTSYADLRFRVMPSAEDNVPPASLGTFGIKSGDAAFACTVTEGLPVADICSTLFSSGQSQLRTAYAQFAITPTQITDRRYYYAAPFAGKITLVYQFLSGIRATSVAMAQACRESMIRAGLLREGTREREGVPLLVSLLCSYDGKNDVFSSFDQAADLLSLMKAKGVNHVLLTLQGLFPGGIAQNASSHLRPASALGAASGFASLCEFAHKQGYQVFGGVNLLLSGERFAAKQLNGDSRRVYVPLQAFALDYGNGVPPSASLLSSDRIDKQAIRILRWMERSAVDGVCVNDAAALHYADAETGADVSAVTSIVNKQLSAFSGAGELALYGANPCMLKDADLFCGLPFEPSAPTSDVYQAAPLLPVVLHGSVCYAGPALNAGSLPTLSFLKCVEYGGIPSVSWVYASGRLLSYESSLPQTVTWCKKINATLSDLYACRIAGHEQVEAGVFRTDYENGACVFVNYNHYSVNVNSIQIPPYDFLRLN